MSRPLRTVSAALAAVLLAACSGSELEQPRIVSFAANPGAVAAGDAAELAWRVEDATMVTITGGPESIVRNASVGSATSGPLSVTTDFVLLAENDAGSVSQSVTVMVGAGATVLVDSFDASPAAILAGDAAELSWTTTGAERVNVSTGGINVLTGGDADGSFTVKPDATTSYSLVAIAADGQRSQSTVVEVEVSFPTPVIAGFTANPNPGELNEATRLTWRVVDAGTIEISDGAGNQVESSTAAVGSAEVVLRQASETFTLTAHNQFGSSTEALTVEADSSPRINSFTVSPGVGAAPLMATVTYDVADARTLTLTANDQPVPGLSFVPDGSAQSASQSLMASVSDSTRFVLTIENGGGESSADQIVIVAAAAAQEMEPNDVAGTAEMLAGGVDQRVGSIGAGGDQDWYSVTVPAGGFLGAALSDGLGRCAFEAALTVYGSDGATELARAEDGPESCPVLEPTTEPALTQLPAGTYYVVVSGAAAASGVYALEVRSGGPQCGNAILEFDRGEDCDDGNTTSGDGCSATCTDENPITYDAPGPAMTLGVPIAANGAGLVHLNVTADTYLRAEAFTNAATNDCVGLDPSFALYDDGRMLLGSDEDDGEQLCPRIDESDGFALLSPGSYVLRVRERSSQAVGVQTVIEGLAANVCGNGILETANFEGCEDGNTVGNDGCSGTCGEERFEGAGNDSRTTAPRLLPLGGRATVRGSISPSTDVDYFSFNVPVGGQLTLRTYASNGNLNSCFGNTRLTLENQFGNEVVQDDNDGTGFCSLISPQRDFQVRNLAPGRYYVRVESGNNSFTQYLLDIVAM